MSDIKTNPTLQHAILPAYHLYIITAFCINFMPLAILGQPYMAKSPVEKYPLNDEEENISVKLFHTTDQNREGQALSG